MQGLFWFFLGGFVYFVVDQTTSFFKKIKFINDVKIHSFKLIGFAYEQLVMTMTAKYMTFHNDPSLDKEKIKLFKNDDELFFEEWKKGTVRGLKMALPPYYEKALELENWDELMDVLDKHYKGQLRTDRSANTIQEKETL